MFHGIVFFLVLLSASSECLGSYVRAEHSHKAEKSLLEELEEGISPFCEQSKRGLTPGLERGFLQERAGVILKYLQEKEYLDKSATSKVELMSADAKIDADDYETFKSGYFFIHWVKGKEVLFLTRGIGQNSMDGRFCGVFWLTLGNAPLYTQPADPHMLRCMQLEIYWGLAYLPTQFPQLKGARFEDCNIEWIPTASPAVSRNSYRSLSRQLLAELAVALSDNDQNRSKAKLDFLRNLKEYSAGRNVYFAQDVYQVLTTLALHDNIRAPLEKRLRTVIPKPQYFHLPIDQGSAQKESSRR